MTRALLLRVGFGAVAPGLLALALAGCGPSREQILVGKWGPSQVSAVTMAFKLQDQGARGSAAYQGGRALTAMELEVRKDRTFTLAWMGHAVQGTWSFNKDTGELLLTQTGVQRLLPVGGGAQSDLPPGPWIAFMDPDNLRLRVYPCQPSQVDMLKQSRGPLADGIPLKKTEE